MALPEKKIFEDKDKISHLIDKLEDEFRWCAAHPNDVSKNELDELKEGIEYLDKKFKVMGGKFYEHFLNFKKKFDYLATHINKLKVGDYQKFDDMIQEFYKDLK